MNCSDTLLEGEPFISRRGMEVSLDDPASGWLIYSRGEWFIWQKSNSLRRGPRLVKNHVTLRFVLFLAPAPRRIPEPDFYLMGKSKQPGKAAAKVSWQAQSMMPSF